MRQIEIKVNGVMHEIDVQPQDTLLDVIRDKLGLTGTKEGCGLGECGACTVLIDGKAMLSCMTLTVECDEKEVTTIEGLIDSKTGMIDPLQQSFIDQGAVQCGFSWGDSVRVCLLESTRP